MRDISLASDIIVLSKCVERYQSYGAHKDASTIRRTDAKLIAISPNQSVGGYKMVGKRVENIEEMIANIKVHTKLGHSVKQLFTELREAYGSHKISNETVRRWRKKFQTGAESVKDATNSGRPVTATGKTSISTVKVISKSDG